MNNRLLAGLKKMEAIAPFMFAPPASNEQINRVEESLGSIFPKEYRDFLLLYGGAMVGPYPVYGVSPADVMGRNLNTIESVTKKFRLDGWIGNGDGVVISENHSGGPVVLQNDGAVLMNCHDGDVERKWRSFDDFLRWCLDR